MARRPRFHAAQFSSLDHIKFQICHEIDREIVRRQMTYKEFAFLAGTSPACISRVTNKQFKNITFNQLFRYLAVLVPNFRILIAT